MNQDNIHEKIMRRIYGVWFLRSTAPLLIIEIIFFGVLFSLIADRVFVEHVVKNTIIASSGNPLRSIMYLVVAFSHTAFATKAILVLIISCLILGLRDANRSIITYMSVHRKNFFSS